MELLVLARYVGEESTIWGRLYASTPMPKWTKESVIDELNVLMNDIDSLVGVRRHSAPHTRWLARTLTFLADVFGENSTYYSTLIRLPWSRSGSVIVSGHDPM